MSVGKIHVSNFIHPAIALQRLDKPFVAARLQFLNELRRVGEIWLAAIYLEALDAAKRLFLKLFNKPALARGKC